MLNVNIIFHYIDPLTTSWIQRVLFTVVVYLYTINKNYLNQIARLQVSIDILSSEQVNCSLFNDWLLWKFYSHDFDQCKQYMVYFYYILYLYRYYICSSPSACLYVCIIAKLYFFHIYYHQYTDWKLATYGGETMHSIEMDRYDWQRVIESWKGQYLNGTIRNLVKQVNRHKRLIWRMTRERTTWRNS